MNKIDKATETQLKNLQARCGKSLEELFAIIHKSGLSKHGEIRDMLKRDLEMGHGDANTLVHVFRATTTRAPAAKIQLTHSTASTPVRKHTCAPSMRN